jgi:hypothetical protein
MAGGGGPGISRVGAARDGHSARPVSGPDAGVASTLYRPLALFMTQTGHRSTPSEGVHAPLAGDPYSAITVSLAFLLTRRRLTWASGECLPSCISATLVGIGARGLVHERKGA